MSSRWTAMAAALSLLAAPGCAHRRHGNEAELRFGGEAARRALWREARLRFALATELGPTDARAWNNLAVALEAEGRLEESFAAYQRALALGQGGGAARRNLDRFLARHGERVRAEAAGAGAGSGP